MICPRAHARSSEQPTATQCHYHVRDGQDYDFESTDLFPAVASQRAFVTRRAFITAIAGRREDTDVRVQEAANKCVGKHFNLSEIGADVLVAAALSRDD